jgi:alkylation response protein AidB-like acyl-CoA dehydrogenase
MNFEFNDDQKALQMLARDFLGKHSGLEVCRAVLESRRSYDEKLWKGAAAMGWLGTAVPEAYGGAGLSHLELVLIAQELGRALAPIPFSSSAYLATEALLLAGTEEQKMRYLPQLTSGSTIGTFAYAEGASDLIDPGFIATRFAGGKLTGEKIPVIDGDVAGIAIVLAKDERDAPALALVDLAATGVTRDVLASFDMSRSQARLRFDGAAAEPLGDAGRGFELFERVLDRAAVIMSFEQLGGAERALEIAREYMMGRYAFGRPVASFQALKHRLADVYCAIELGRSHAYYGAWALSTGSDELSVAAAGARISASDAFALAAEEMVQFHGGIGFTWEYDCHLFYRRAKLLSLALGRPSEWREKLIRRLMAQDAA